MASQADVSKGIEGSNQLTEPTEVQHQNDFEALNDKLAKTEEKMALCNAVLEDLRAVQRIVQDKKGLNEAVIQAQKN